MYHACGNALVCDTMEVAKFITQEKGREVKGMFMSDVVYSVVTLEGTIIQKSSLMTGGAVGNKEDPQEQGDKAQKGTVW
jgi:structural maintenance of chromosome 1